MAKKRELSSYKKLLQEKQKLERELRLVCTDPTCIEALMIASRERMVENESNVILYKNAVDKKPSLMEEALQAAKKLEEVRIKTRTLLSKYNDTDSPLNIWP